MSWRIFERPRRRALDVGLPAVQAAAEAAVNLITYMDLKALRDKVAAVAAVINTGVACRPTGRPWGFTRRRAGRRWPAPWD